MLILRYELTQKLMAGRLLASDLPKALDSKMRDYLDLSTIDNSANSLMQDVHWPNNAVDYFPSYTLGTRIVAQ